MVRILKYVFIAFTIGICVSIPIFTANPDLHIQEEHIVNIPPPIPQQKRNIRYITRTTFYAHIAKTESKGSYTIANRSMLLGKYQAGKHALLEFGYSEEKLNQIYATIDTTFTKTGKPRYNFDISLFPPAEQERFIRWYMQQMEKKHLKQYIKKYSGKTIQGVYISKPGILYASMMGYAHVQRYLDSGGKKNYYAGSGTSIGARLKKYRNTEFKD